MNYQIRSIRLALTLLMGCILLVSKAQQPVLNLPYHPSAGCLAVSPDEHNAVTGGGNTIELWDLSTQRLVRLLTGHQRRVVSICFSPDGHLIASGSDDGTVRIWETSTGKELNQWRMQLWEPTNKDLQPDIAVAFLPDGKHIAAANGLGVLRIYPIAKKQPSLTVSFSRHDETFGGSDFKLNGLAVSPSDSSVWVIMKGWLYRLNPGRRQIDQVTATATGLSPLAPLNLQADSAHIVLPNTNYSTKSPISDGPFYGLAFTKDSRTLFLGRKEAGKDYKTVYSLDRFQNKIPSGPRLSNVHLGIDPDGVSVQPFAIDAAGHSVFYDKKVLDVATGSWKTVYEGVGGLEGIFVRNGNALLTLDSYYGFRIYQRMDMKAYYARLDSLNGTKTDPKLIAQDRYNWWEIGPLIRNYKVPYVQSAQFVGNGSQALLSLTNDEITLGDSAKAYQKTKFLLPAVLRDLFTGELIQRFQLPLQEGVYTIPNLQFCALSGGDDFISVHQSTKFQFTRWTPSQARPVSVLSQTSSREPFALRAVPQTRQFLSISKSAIEHWDVSAQSLIHSFSVTGNINDAGTSPDGTLVYAATGQAPSTVLGLEFGEQYRQIEAYQKRVSEGLNDLVMWDATTGKVVKSFKGHEGTLIGASFLADGRIISAGRLGAVRVWDAVTGAISQTLLADTSVIIGFNVFPDRHTVMLEASTSASGSQKAFQYDAITGKIAEFVYATYRGAKYDVPVNATFSPSGKYRVFAWGNYDSFGQDKLGEGQVDIYEWPQKPAYQIYSKLGFKAADLALLSPAEDELIIGSLDGKVTVISVAKKIKLRQFQAHKTAIQQMQLSPDGQVLVTSDGEKTFSLWERATGKLIRTVNTDQSKLFTLIVSPDGSRIYTGHTSGMVGVFDMATGKQLSLWQAQAGDVRVLTISADGQHVLAGGGDPEALRQVETFRQQLSRQKAPQPVISIWNLKTKFPIHTLIGHHSAVNCADISADNQLLVSGGDDYRVRLWDLTKGTSLSELTGHKAPVTLVRFLPNGQQFISRDADGLVIIWDKASYKPLRQLQTPLGLADISPDGNRLLINSTLWDLARNEEVATFSQLAQGNWLTTLPNQTCFGPPEAIQQVSYSLGRDAFGFDEFDLQYNRPDLVLRQLGCPDTSRIRAYEIAFKKRLAKSGLTEELVRQNKVRPMVTVLNQQQIPLSTSQPQIALTLYLRDTTSRINRLHVWVNDVPLYGIPGKSLKPDSAHRLTVYVPLGQLYRPNELTINPKSIQVACTNERGSTSFRQTLQVQTDFEAKARPIIHFIGIGVDHYRDSTMNLQYSTKDVRDLAKAFRELNYKNYYIQDSSSITTLLNEQVTRENILALKKRLLTVKPADVVVLALSGHGVLSDSLDFYYATQDIDFRHPEGRGLAYQQLESLLDSLPTQQKILLIDACHSGEVDRQIQQKTEDSSPLAKGVTGRGVKNGSSAGGNTDAFTLMQQTYANLSRGTGAFIISAAGGREYAYEGESWRNGVFTYSLLRAFQEKQVDADGDGYTTVREVSEYVRQQVRQLTNGRQVPTVRSSNQFLNFSLLRR